MPLGVVPEDVSAEAIAFAKKSFKITDIDAWRASDSALASLYDAVLAGIVRNVKTKEGGFVATSGVVLPYYLNLSTNFMDPTVAPLLVELVTVVLLRFAARELSGVAAAGEKIAIVGPEVAGGMLVSQLSASGNRELSQRFEFVYMRKHRKTTGTAQQLEALQKYTARTPRSPPCKAIWIDDVNSTGSSLCEGITTLREEYNMDVIAALYVVDRSADRQGLPSEKQRLSDEHFRTGATQVCAIIDLAEVDAIFNKGTRGADAPVCV